MPPQPDNSAVDLRGREVLICVCGGIAAYKVAEVASRLVQRGAGVSVAMTRAARKFVGPVTFEALTGRPVLRSIWPTGGEADIEHIRRTERADVIIVAPATANILGKIAGGIADEVVSTLVISAAGPVLLAPAMNSRMWASPAVQHNLSVLKSRGFHVVGPGEGWLACRSVGPGRMAEPEQILEVLLPLLTSRSDSLPTP